MNNIKNLTPGIIVNELDKYIIGQNEAKKSVAIALRNRWRRQQISGELQNEITPNNIILIGPTGVGKTEIARRLSKLADAPFIKVEASKFTEVGYVGRDVESMIRELLDLAINEVRIKMLENVYDKAYSIAVEKVIDILCPIPKKKEEMSDEEYKTKLYDNEKLKMIKRNDLFEKKLDDVEINIDISNRVENKKIEVFSNINMELIDMELDSVIGSIFPNKKKQNKNKILTVKKAIEYYTEQESAKMVDKEKVIEVAKNKVEENGIIFIDEIDKIADRQQYDRDISRSGVQRDLLPIVEGSSVPTKYGLINTSHILFIAAGAFHYAKPSDLIPELQGRFPIRVELNSLTKTDFEKILKYPQNSLIKQYKALFKTENVNLDFEESAIETIADFAFIANEKMEDIGARRLYTILNALLEEKLFSMPEEKIDLTVTKKFVENKLASIIESEDLSKYIL